MEKAGLSDEASELRFNDDKLSFFAVSVNSCFSSVAADFIRQKLLEAGVSFTFETVMSRISFMKMPNVGNDNSFARKRDFGRGGELWKSP
jgi:hypothetical protein